jgi:pimeloyl-ACP methyl ester carboxylesterase
VVPSHAANRGPDTLNGSLYFHEADRGGHFAMWEHSELFAAELRAAFKALR